MLKTRLNFKCEVCHKKIKIKKNVKFPFDDWAYYQCIQWSNFDDKVPDLSEDMWQRCIERPKENEIYKVYVTKPFDEIRGSEFFVIFEPAIIVYNGWDSDFCSEEDIEKCSLVKCRYDRIVKANKYSAWIEITVQKVIPLADIYNLYNEKESSGIFLPFGSTESQVTLFENRKWLVFGWNDQGDVGEYRWVYIDSQGKKHCVLEYNWEFDKDILYLGNIVEPIR